MRTRFETLAATLLVLALAACERAPDTSALAAERLKAVQRFDNFQAAAANGKVVIGAGGSVIVASTDDGATWNRTALAPPASIVAMSACPDGTFAALDFYRKVWIGDAQGRDWKPSVLAGDFNPVSLTCDPRGRLWVVGSFSTVMSSADDGHTWVAGPQGEDAILTGIQFVDDAHGFIAGEFGTLLVTADGGTTWTKQAGLPETFYPYALRFADSRRGWVSGLSGTILATADGGVTWTGEANGASAPMYALIAVDAAVFAVGEGGRLLQRGDNGWTPVPNIPHFPSYLAAAAPLGRGLLVAGAGGALQVVGIGTEVARLGAPVTAVESRR